MTPTDREELFPNAVEVTAKVEPRTIIITTIASYLQRDKLLGELNRRFVGNFLIDHGGQLHWRTPERISNIMLGEQETRISCFVQGWVAAKTHPIG